VDTILNLGDLLLKKGIVQRSIIQALNFLGNRFNEVEKLGNRFNEVEKRQAQVQARVQVQVQAMVQAELEARMPRVILPPIYLTGPRDSLQVRFDQ
jgi:hypothetical protein